MGPSNRVSLEGHLWIREVDALKPSQVRVVQGHRSLRSVPKGVDTLLVLMSTALIRGIPDSFGQALRQNPSELDIELARSQHGAYAQRLAEAGYTLEEVPSSNQHPDCVFVEDAAVVVGEVAIVCRPGAPSRRGEVGPVADSLATWFPLTTIHPPGTVDGGDVLVVNGTVYVGLSSRTNREAIDQMTSVANSQGLAVRAVEVEHVLHLKSAVLAVDDETIVITPNTVDEAIFDGLQILYEAEAERNRFSALPLPDGTVLVTANAPETADLVSARGLDVVPIDVSEILAADGGLTCMSIRF